jgi:putative ABC transport system ATP-binding protein
MVRAVGVTKVYDTGHVKVDALRGIDLDIQCGEMVAIMGPSGCGKTTLLNCLSGLDALSGGDVLIEGTSLKSMSDRQRIYAVVLGAALLTAYWPARQASRVYPAQALRYE